MYTDRNTYLRLNKVRGGHFLDTRKGDFTREILDLSHMFGYVEQKLLRTFVLGRLQNSLFFLKSIFSAVRNFNFQYDPLSNLTKVKFQIMGPVKNGVFYF
jgi:hypothetical protein